MRTLGIASIAIFFAAAFAIPLYAAATLCAMPCCQQAQPQQPPCCSITKAAARTPDTVPPPAPAAIVADATPAPAIAIEHPHAVIPTIAPPLLVRALHLRI